MNSPTASSSMQYSGYRLAQTTWFVTSAYLAFLIAEVTKDGLVMAIFSPGLRVERIWLIVPTLLLYFLTAAEAYLWLNPKEDEPLSAVTAAFRGTLLVIFIVAVITQALLLYPCREHTLSEGKAAAYWLFTFSAVLCVYLSYNVVWAIKRLMLRFKVIEIDNECPPASKIALYIGHYALFSLAALLLGRVIASSPDGYGPQVCAFFFCYLCTYLRVWWGTWHKEALKLSHARLYGLPTGTSEGAIPKNAEAEMREENLSLRCHTEFHTAKDTPIQPNPCPSQDKS